MDDNCKTDGMNQHRRIILDDMPKKTSLALSKKLFVTYDVMYGMQSLKSFADQTIKKGREDIKNFDEFKKILDILGANEKPTYLKYKTHSNT